MFLFSSLLFSCLFFDSGGWSADFDDSDPRRLTLFLLETAIERGVKLHQPYTPTKLIRDPDGSLKELQITSSTGDGNQDRTIPCTRLILAAGAWTPSVYQQLFPNSKHRIPISPLAGHSLLLRTDLWKKGDNETTPPTNSINSIGKSDSGGCHAVYTSSSPSTTPNSTKPWSPEIFSRAHGEIYIAGLNDPHLPLPRLATDRVLEPEKLGIIMGEARRLIGLDGQDSELEVLREGLCFRPVTERGVPIVAEVERDIYVAAGHGPWGISLSLGTGRVVAGMVLGIGGGVDVEGLGLGLGLGGSTD